MLSDLDLTPPEQFDLHERNLWLHENFLRLQPGANLISSGNLTGATIDFFLLRQTYRELQLRITGLSFDTATRALTLVHSINGGVSWISSGYVSTLQTSAPAFSGTTAVLAGLPNQAAADTTDCLIQIRGLAETAYLTAEYVARISTGVFAVGRGYYNVAMGDNLSLRLGINGSGNFDAGTFALIGIR